MIQTERHVNPHSAKHLKNKYLISGHFGHEKSTEKCPNKCLKPVCNLAFSFYLLGQNVQFCIHY